MNLTHRYGWGGEVLGGEPQGGDPPASADRYYTYAGNRRADAGFTYDAAGNLTFDGGQHFTYDAAGRQTYVDWTHLQQSYDGDGLRVRKSDDSTSPVYYLRSSVLGGQVIAEINSSGGWQRGYVFAGSSLLAVQQGGVFFVHEDPVAKSKRVTAMSGSVVSSVELDPYGAETTRSGNAAFQPKKFITYERDYNGTDEAMFRRYNRWHARFDQPDPYEGSYDLTDPQSFNRYSYVQGDPVNFVDPTGLDLMNNPPWVDSNPGFIPASQNGWNRLAVYNQFSFHNETMRATVREFWSPRYEGEPPPDFYPVFVGWQRVGSGPRSTPQLQQRAEQQLKKCYEDSKYDYDTDIAIADDTRQAEVIALSGTGAAVGGGVRGCN